jgi:hypothetical protein
MPEIGASPKTRPIEPMLFPDTPLNEQRGDLPLIEWVSPKALHVDDTYQRSLSKESVNLIRRIASRWDWARFKPPIVARTPSGLEVIDGQHTAIAAASRGDILEIPVVLVTAPEVVDRANAFVGHNRDRLALSTTQIYYAQLAAGDEDALTVAQVCHRAGVKILRFPPPNGLFNIGETIGIVTIRQLIGRRGAMASRVVLQAIADAHCAPVRADHIKAVEELLYGEEYRGSITADAITSEIMRLGPELEKDARIFASAHEVRVWRGMAVVIFRGARRGRRRAG